MTNPDKAFKVVLLLNGSYHAVKEMNVKTVELHYKKPKDGVHFIDITRQVEHTIVDSKMNDGIAIIHAHNPNTCITTMEFEPGSIKDMHHALKNMIPKKGAKGKRIAHGKDVRPSLIGSSIAVPFKDNREMLGKWQKVILMDFDGREDEKKVIVQMMGE